MSPKAIFSTYFKDLAAVAHQGDAREESFYPALAKMLDGIAQATGRVFPLSAFIPAAPTGTLRTAGPQRPIVILAAAGIQSPFYV